MAAGSTYEAIATQTLGSAAATVTFSSIPATYTDLVLVSQPIGTADLNFLVRFNGDTATNYSNTILAASGTVSTSFRYTNATSLRGNYYGYVTANSKANTIIQIMNYANTSIYKTTLSKLSNASAGLDAAAGLWRGTGAISSITILNDNSTTFAAGSTFTIYGITAA
jgi:hypothetical protein